MKDGIKDPLEWEPVREGVHGAWVNGDAGDDVGWRDTI